MGSSAMKRSTRTNAIAQIPLHMYRPDIPFLKGNISPDAWSVVARTKVPTASTNVSEPNQSVRKNISEAVYCFIEGSTFRNIKVKMIEVSRKGT